MRVKRNKVGRNSQVNPAVYCYSVRFNKEEHNRFPDMFGKSGVYASFRDISSSFSDYSIFSRNFALI